MLVSNGLRSICGVKTLWPAWVPVMILAWVTCCWKACTVMHVPSQLYYIGLASVGRHIHLQGHSFHMPTPIPSYYCAWSCAYLLILILDHGLMGTSPTIRHSPVPTHQLFHAPANLFASPLGRPKAVSWTCWTNHITNDFILMKLR